MAHYAKLTGLALIVAGTGTLLASRLMGWTEINIIQQTALGLIIAGIITCVAAMKNESRY